MQEKGDRMKRKLCCLMSAVLALGVCFPGAALQAAAAESAPSPLASEAPVGVVGEEAVDRQAPDLTGDVRADAEEPRDAVSADTAVDPSPKPSGVAADAAAKVPQETSFIWVNGSSGSDASDGSEASPVETFVKAKELLQAFGAQGIYVSGALKVPSSATWDLGGKALLRADGYRGELVIVDAGKHLTLENIVLDGRSGEGQIGAASGGDGKGGSLVGVYSGTLTVADGAVLQNNCIQSAGHWYPESGGGVFANKATVNIEGGTIRNNQAVWGGGIYGIYGSVINISGGVISGNRADAGKPLPDVDKDYGGSGGGVCAHEGTAVNFSAGTITGNYASERGGGISMGTFYASTTTSAVLTMTGGSVTENKAGSSGGGIFVQAGYSASGHGGTPTYSIAYITGGTISGNSMTAEGKGNKAFGGGGIYVNGYSSKFSDFQNGELHLANVEVSRNSAASEGGGYAACPVSTTEISLTNGATFFGNATDGGNARELYILASLAYGAHSGDPVYEISPSMLGGGAYGWVFDGGAEVPLDKLKGTLSAFFNQSLSLSNNLTADDAGVKKALGLATVHITGNTSATRGGGIGSNGSTFVGKSVETTEVSVSKTWNDANDKDKVRPDSIKVNLYRDGDYVGFQTVSPDNDGNWSATFGNLPKNDPNGRKYAYTVEERAVGGYTAEVSGDAANGFKIANTLTMDVSGAKTWNDDDDRDGLRPASIVVNLMNGSEKVASKTVTEADGWRYSFTGLAKYDADGNECRYTVTEDAVAGYQATVNGTDLVNVHEPDKVSVSVFKVWKDGGDKDGKRPGSVKVQLYANDVALGDPVVLDAASLWTHTWSDLYRKEGGKDISYTVREADAPAGYTVSVTGDAAAGFIVTNTKVEEVPPGPKHKPKKEVPPHPNGGSKKVVKVSSMPGTGDDASALVVVCLAGLACIGSAAAAVSVRRRNDE